MKSFFIAVSCLAFTSTAVADSNASNRFTGGLGLGAIYSGLGGNIAVVSETDMKYISLGCSSYSSQFGSSCGAGLGWIKTDLFTAAANKHGLGIYISNVGQETRVRLVNNRYSFKQKNVYGLGLSYTYFRSGIGAAGVNYGISIHVADTQFGNEVNGFFQLGYQF